MKTFFLAATAVLALGACDRAGDNKAAAPATSGSGTVAGGQAPGATDWTTVVTATPEGGFRMGNPDARVKLVEFGSMTCHVCRDFAKDSTPALEENYVKTGQVSFEFRNFLRDPVDVAASLLARCGGPAPFFKLTEQMYADQDALLARSKAISPADVKSMEGKTPGQEMVRLAQLTELDKFVGMRGIPAAKANACLTNEPEINRLVAANQSAAKQYKIAGTPTFLINGEPVTPPTATDVSFWQDLEPKLKAAIGA